MLVAPARRTPHLAAMREQPAHERHRLVIGGMVAGDRDEQRGDLLGREVEMIGRAVHRQQGRARIEMQFGRSRLAVEAAIFEADIGGAEQLARAGAAARAPGAAHLEQIGEIIVEQEGQVDAGGPVAMVLDADALIGGAAPQEQRAHDVDQILLQDDALAVIDVGIGEVDRQRGIVVAQVRTEQQRLGLVQHQFEPRQIARIGIEQAVGAAGGGADVAMAVENNEGVVMFQRATRPRGLAGHRNVERRFRDLLHGGWIRQLDVGFDRPFRDPCPVIPCGYRSARRDAGLTASVKRVRLRGSRDDSFPASRVPGKVRIRASAGPAGRPR